MASAGDLSGPERLWERMRAAEEQSRPSLNRRRIVEAAVRIADAEGLDAVTMRKIAAELGSSPMALYRHVDRKEDLPELMLDAVLGEMELPDRPSGDWRADLRLLSRRRREVLLRHTWLSGVFGAHPPVGPHATAYLEATLAAVAGLDAEPSVLRGIVGSVDLLVTGSVMREMAERELLRGSGMNRQEAVLTAVPFMRKIADSGRYPNIARIMIDDAAAATEHSDEAEDAAFLGVLDCLLDGLESRLLNRRDPA